MAVESAADLAALFSTDDFAVAATYTPPGGGTAQSVNVILDQGARLERGGEEQKVIRRRELRALKSAFTTAPARGGTFVVGGTSFTVRAVEDDPDDPAGVIHLVKLALP